MTAPSERPRRDGVVRRWWASPTLLAPRFAREKAFAFRTVLIALAPLSLGSAMVEAFPAGADTPLVIYAVLVSFAVATAFFVGTGRFVNVRLSAPGAPRTAAVLLVFGLTEVLRTVAFTLILIRYDGGLELMLPHRFLAGALTGILIISLVALVVGDRAEYARQYAALGSRQAELRRELTHLTHTIDMFIEQLRDSVQQAVDAALEPLMARRDRQRPVHDIVSDIVRVSEQVVRPLTQQVANALPPPASEKTTRPRVAPGELVRLTSLVQPFRVVLMPTVFFLLFFSASIFILPTPHGLILLGVVMGVVALTHYGGAVFVAPRLPRWSTGVRIVVVAGIYAMGFGVGALVLLSARGFGSSLDRVPTLIYMFLIVQLVSWGLATLPALRFGQLAILEKMATATSDLAQTRARAEVRLWREKQRLAATVHGDIQSILMATALRLQHPEPGRGNVTNILEETRKAIAESLRKMREMSSPRSFCEVKEHTSDFWAGILAITWTDDDAVEEVVSADPNLAETLWQVIREATANAVKHGRATSIDIQLAVEKSRAVLNFRAKDNGHAATSTQYSGGGLRLFAAVADTVGMSITEGATELTLALPLSSSTGAVSVT